MRDITAKDLITKGDHILVDELLAIGQTKLGNTVLLKAQILIDKDKEESNHAYVILVDGVMHSSSPFVYEALVDYNKLIVKPKT